MAKRILRSFLLSLFVAICFAMFSSPAFAEMDPVKFGHWMGIGLKASNIIGQSTLPVVAPFVDFICDPFEITEGVYRGINYAFPRVNLETPSMTLDNYLQRSSIQVRGDTITIDGIDYQDIWVTNDAAQALRTNVLDLQTAFEIASNSSGNFVEGAGYFDGIPIFMTTSESFETQRYWVSSGNSYSVGNVLLNGFHSGYDYIIRFTLSNGFKNGGYSNSDPGPFWFSGRVNSSFELSSIQGNTDDQTPFVGGDLSSLLVYNPFDFTWVAKDIYPSALESDDGLHIYVPNNPDQFSESEVKQKINTFNINLHNNFEFNTPIDLSTENHYTLFDHLFDVAVDLDIKPQFGPYNITPPAPTPSPTEPVPWPTLEPTPEPTLEPTPVPSSEPTPEPSSEPSPVPSAWPSPAPTSPIGDTPFNLLDDGLGRLFDALKNGFNNLVDSFEFGEANYFGSILDSLFDAFLALFDRLKSVLGIWRYVVAWVGNISAPLNWTLSALGNAGSYFLSPFAAIAAASVVIAIYRRFFK